MQPLSAQVRIRLPSGCTGRPVPSSAIRSVSCVSQPDSTNIPTTLPATEKAEELIAGNSTARHVYCAARARHSQPVALVNCCRIAASPQRQTDPRVSVKTGFLRVLTFMLRRPCSLRNRPAARVEQDQFMYDLASSPGLGKPAMSHKLLQLLNNSCPLLGSRPTARHTRRMTGNAPIEK